MILLALFVLDDEGEDSYLWEMVLTTWRLLFNHDVVLASYDRVDKYTDLSNSFESEVLNYVLIGKHWERSP